MTMQPELRKIRQKPELFFFPSIKPDPKIYSLALNKQDYRKISVNRIITARIQGMAFGDTCQ